MGKILETFITKFLKISKKNFEFKGKAGGKVLIFNRKSLNFLKKKF